MLTARQQQLLGFIRGCLADRGTAPTQSEMAAALGVASKSTVHRMLLALEERGAIRRLPFRSRAIEVVEPLPADLRSDVRAALMDARTILRGGDLAPEGRDYRIDRIDRLVERLA